VKQGRDIVHGTDTDTAAAAGYGRQRRQSRTEGTRQGTAAARRLISESRNKLDAARRAALENSVDGWMQNQCPRMWSLDTNEIQTAELKRNWWQWRFLDPEPNTKRSFYFEPPTTKRSFYLVHDNLNLSDIIKWVEAAHNPHV